MFDKSTHFKQVCQLLFSLIVDHMHPPLFSSAKLKMAIAAVKVILVSSDDKTVESEVGANSNANVFVALNLVTLLDFSEQDFILETVMRSYSR